MKVLGLRRLQFILRKSVQVPESSIMHKNVQEIKKQRKLKLGTIKKSASKHASLYELGLQS